MEGHVLTMSNNSYNHAAAPSTAARSARSPVTIVVIARGTNVGDARNGGQDIQPPTALSLTARHEKHGKEAKSGLR